MEILQQLYDSEINGHISWAYDGGFDVKLGANNGYVAEATNIPTVREAIAWLRENAIKHYPESEFAKSQK